MMLKKFLREKGVLNQYVSALTAMYQCMSGLELRNILRESPGSSSLTCIHHST